MKYENAIQCLQVMKGAECINALSQEFPEHYGIENIEALELAIEVLKKNRWIPCSERLPEEAGDYLVTIYLPQHDRRFMSFKNFDGVRFITELVIAWMPLPEPYEEGEYEKGTNIGMGGVEHDKRNYHAGSPDRPARRKESISFGS